MNPLLIGGIRCATKFCVEPLCVPYKQGVAGSSPAPPILGSPGKQGVFLAPKPGGTDSCGGSWKDFEKRPPGVVALSRSWLTSKWRSKYELLSTSPGYEIKPLAIGLAAGIIFDATVIRALLVPALMKLLGEANWWMPRWMGIVLRIPRREPTPEDRSSSTSSGADLTMIRRGANERLSMESR